MRLVRPKGNDVPTLSQKAPEGFSSSHHWASSSTLPLSPTQRRVLTICLHLDPHSLCTSSPWPILGPLQAAFFPHSLLEVCGTRSSAPGQCHPHWHLAPAPSARLPSDFLNSQLSLWPPPAQNSAGMSLEHLVWLSGFICPCSSAQKRSTSLRSESQRAQSTQSQEGGSRYQIRMKGLFVCQPPSPGLRFRLGRWLHLPSLSKMTAKG